MKHLRHTLFVLLTFFITLHARPCGPDFPAAVFVLETGPSGDYAKYAAGHLDVPQAGYRTRHLVIAYDTLSGHGLAPEVQKEAVATNAYLLDPWQADDSGKPLMGFSAWIAARSAFPAFDGYTPDASLPTQRLVPGQDYQSFNNCLDDAFAAAARTLKAHVAAYTAKDPAVADWVRAQDAVFSNCGDGKPANYFGPADKKPVPPPAPHAPTPAPANSPAWLKQDRAYQLAAASFYALHFDDALTRFGAIAEDKDSPWSTTARYLVVRTYLRRASIEDAGTAAGGDQSRKEEAARRYKATMTLAQRELVAMQSEPRMAAMRGAVNGLLDYVNLRLQPNIQAAVLATRLQSPSVATFRQAVIDLTWLHTDHDYGATPVPALNAGEQSNDMLAWIDAVSSKDEAGALKQWRSSHSVAWLVAALANARPGDSATPELMRAAKALSPADPGWLAVTYDRLRLSPRDAARRSEVLALLPQIRSSGDVSATNLFLTLATETAPGLDEWLKTVPRVPVGIKSESDGEEGLTVASVGTSGNAGEGSQPAFVEDSCGKKFPANTVLPLFDSDAAVALNREMPLRMLAMAAESSTLPENLRFQVAQATWTRAVLLDKPEIAHRMSSPLIACRAALKPVLDAYDAAMTTDARHAAGLLALMRFASTVPSVWEGEDRRQGFAKYDELRQNWWCSAVPKPGATLDSDPDPVNLPAGVRAPPASKVEIPATPSFLSQADTTEARAEVAVLERIPRASTYFAQQALAWQRLHASDPQTPDILGEADRVLRNSCRKDPPYDVQGSRQVDATDMNLTANLAKALFETLHQKYPNSVWAKRYTSWQ